MTSSIAQLKAHIGRVVGYGEDQFVPVPDSADERRALYENLCRELRISISVLRSKVTEITHSDRSPSPVISPQERVQIEFERTSNNGVQLRLVRTP